MSLRVEWHKTGVRSYEHVPRITGFTSGGHVVGDPLGTPWGVVMPWTQVAELASDTYDFTENGPIVRTGDGVKELRLRIGVRARVPIRDGLELDPEATLEDIERASFVPGGRRLNAMLRAVLVWRPSADWATFGTR